LDDTLPAGVLWVFAVMSAFLFASFPPLQASLLSAALYLQNITMSCTLVTNAF
jgi:hypothetical protein